MHADYSDDAPAAGKAPEGKNSSAPGGKNATAPAAAGKGKSEDAGGSGKLFILWNNVFCRTLWFYIPKYRVKKAF